MGSAAAASGHLATRRTELLRTPTQMKRTGVMPIVARYKDAANKGLHAKAPPAVINELAERKIIER